MRELGDIHEEYESLVEKNLTNLIMDLRQMPNDISQRRISNALRRKSIGTVEKKDMTGRELEGSAINLILEEAMSKDGENQLEKNIHLIREYNANDVSGNLRSTIGRLKERLHRGEDRPEIRMMLRIILRRRC